METQTTNTTEVADVADATAPNAAPAQAPGLSLNDLTSVVNLIDVCSRRGAFEGPELAGVGLLRNRIADFLKANTPKDAPAAPAADAAPTA